MNILTVSNISKRYGRVQALDGVSFEVPRGSIFGILGPNGSGKTTLLGITTDCVNADSGTYRLFEDGATPVNLLRRRIGTLLETPCFYPYLPATDNLRIACLRKGVDPKHIGGVLEKVGLYRRRDSRFASYSLGMKQRLGIASALLGDPELLILDEPLNGLDPEGIAEIRALILELGASGHTVVMASRLLDEVEKVCTHVAILKSGRLLSVGKVDEITAEGDIVELAAADTQGLCALLKRENIGRKIAVDGGIVTVLFAGKADTAYLNELCHRNGIVLTRLLLRKQSMESIFLEVVAKQGRA
ncbi:MAG: ATP-binding cassette domain-containing protein [Rikenellaceae bacterium]|nr:ATP-binding cassette domain-containing protein [Rikenellaceae bacterium]